MGPDSLKTRRVWCVAGVCAAFLLLAGCSGGAEAPSRQIGEAYAGPFTLKLRQDVDPHSAEVASVQHGDRLAILKRRRRFVRVRTVKGVEGWTDIRQLLSTEQMQALNDLAGRASELPSQGAASVYEQLNVHTEANRFAPSFYRIKEKELVEVVAQHLGPRVPLEARRILPPPPPPKPKAQKPKETPSRVPPPAMPPAPKLPDNWLELSRTAEPEGTGDADSPDAEPAKPVPVDDWTLVRLSNGRAGWVLTGMLRMNIPDEVAQYSEGHRITSYFAMGDVRDGGQTKHHWLWTTLGSQRQPYQFDSFRYFVWNARRHRYETAFIAKNLRGYYPVEVRTVNVKGQTLPAFSMIVEDGEGVRWRKTFTYQAYRVLLVEKVQWEPPSLSGPALGLRLADAPGGAESPGVWARVKETVAGWKRRVFGK